MRDGLCSGVDGDGVVCQPQTIPVVLEVQQDRSTDTSVVRVREDGETTDESKGTVGDVGHSDLGLGRGEEINMRDGGTPQRK